MTLALPKRGFCRLTFLSFWLTFFGIWSLTYLARSWRRKNPGKVPGNCPKFQVIPGNIPKYSVKNTVFLLALPVNFRSRFFYVLSSQVLLVTGMKPFAYGLKLFFDEPKSEAVATAILSKSWKFWDPIRDGYFWFLAEVFARLGWFSHTKREIHARTRFCIIGCLDFTSFHTPASWIRKWFFWVHVFHRPDVGTSGHIPVQFFIWGDTPAFCRSYAFGIMKID